jgi:two-component system sensor histidine kinase PilS (NtrC family)
LADRAVELAGSDRRLLLLVGARLGLALLALGIAVYLDASGDILTLADRPGPYGTVAFAFLATVVCGLALPRVRNSRRFAAWNIAIDLAIVSALVEFSGGTDSVFTFLYVLVAFYAAIALGPVGVRASVAATVLTYAAVLGAGGLGWIAPNPSGVSESPSVLASLWSVHAVAVALAAYLGSSLAGELRRAGEALDLRESDLRELQNLHRLTVESLMSGLLTTDASGRVTSFNPEAERITGVPRTLALGRAVAELLPGIEGELEPLPGRREGGTRSRMPYTNRRGEALYLGVGMYPLRRGDAAASPSGKVVIFQDVSQVVAMERELRRVDRLAAVGQLSASIAHEIRNPLAAISGAVQVLHNKSNAGDSDAARLMDIAVRETDRLNQLITDFLLYARPGSERRERVEVAALAGEVAEMLGAAGLPGVRVEVSVAEDLALDADPAQLRQVLWNLVLNAAQAMPEGGAIRISASRVAPESPQAAAGAGRNGEAVETQTWVEIAVADRGVGIPPEHLERIFDPFFTSRKEGTGLGLATVHRIVESHGGQIRVETEVGRGSIFRVRLPASRSAIPARTPGVADKPESGART